VAYLLDIDTALGTIRGAFDPLACRVDMYDDRTRIHLRVCDINGKPVIETEDLFLANLLDLDNLRVELQRTREAVQRRGFMLKKWSCPW
jgi:hypothetical protein